LWHFLPFSRRWHKEEEAKEIKEEKKERWKEERKDRLKGRSKNIRDN
jgi:hypothetical protein